MATREADNTHLRSVGWRRWTIAVWLIVLGLGGVLAYRASSFNLNTPSPDPLFVDSGDHVTLNLAAFTNGRGQLMRDHGRTLYQYTSPSKRTTFWYDCVFNGKAVTPWSGDGAEPMRMSLYFDPHDGVPDTFMCARPAGPGEWDVFCFIDADALNKGATELVHGLGRQDRCAFSGTEVYPGIYMTSLKDDPSRFMEAGVRASGVGLILGAPDTFVLFR